MARFLLASGAFGDSLNHAYKADMEDCARTLLYGFDRSNELNIKAHLLKGYSKDREGAFSLKAGSRTGSSPASSKRHGRTMRPPEKH